MSDFFGRIGSFQRHPLEGVNNVSQPHELNEENLSEVREDIGTPLDDEPEIGENGTIAGFNVPIQDTSLMDQVDKGRNAGAENETGEQVTVDKDLSEEDAWVEETSRPHSSTAATPTQDDNVSPEDISRIPVPATGPQFLSFSQPSSLVHGAIQVEAMDSIGSIPLPQVRDDGSDAEVAIVDAIANINAIPVNIDEVPSDKDSDGRDLSDHEITEKDEFGRDTSRRKKGAAELDPNKVVTIEEVSDDDLPEVIEERTQRDRNGEERVSDADSSYSMVSNNSLAGENCQLAEKDKKTKGDSTKKTAPEITERDEISSLSDLSSEDEARGSDRLQVCFK